MFRFKIYSAVEFLRIKLWLHQKTEGRDQYFNWWVYYATKTFNWVGNSVLIFGVSSACCFPAVCDVCFLRAQLSWPSRCVSDRIWCQQCDSTHSLSGGWCQRPCGHGWVGGWGGGVSLKTALFPSDISLKAVDRKEQQHMRKNEPSCAFHFRCTAESGPDRPQIPGALFSGPLQGDRPGCWLWRHHLPGGQTPVTCSVMRWMTSCPWPAVWTDPVGYHCSVCTPSAGSRNACCRLL